MERTEKKIEGDGPLRTVYNQCTQFEEFGGTEASQARTKHCLRLQVTVCNSPPAYSRATVGGRTYDSV